MDADATSVPAGSAPETATPRVVRAEVESAQPSRPVARIAVLASLNFPQMTAETAGLVTSLTRGALATLTGLGAAYEFFDTSTPLPDPRAVADCDGLLMLGGGDVDGRMYGGPTEDVSGSFGVDLQADRDAVAALEAAVDAGRPVLAICRGMQLLNVSRGGTLVPDIADPRLHHGVDGEPFFIDERILLAPESRVAAILGTGLVEARGGHHQAVDQVGEGLVPMAWAADGLIEGIEDPDRWIIGVQWHPEDDDNPPHHRHGLFAAFVEASASS